jgi:hypothetical protein
MHQRQCLERHVDGRFEHARRGVAHQNVEPVEMLAERRVDLVDRIRDADAALDRHRAPPERTNLAAERFGLVGAVVIIGGDVAARAGELQRGRPPDAAGGAGDERDFAGQRR